MGAKAKALKSKMFARPRKGGASVPIGVTAPEVDWERAAMKSIGPDAPCAGCGRKPEDDRDRARWIVLILGYAPRGGCRLSRICSMQCSATALRKEAGVQERTNARLSSDPEFVKRALGLTEDEEPAGADEPARRSLLEAPEGPAETDEQRRWSEEAELEEREIIERCARG